MANENVFLGGVRLFAPHASAPDFVIAGGVITVDDLMEFLKANQNYLTDYNGKKQIKFKINRSKDGKPCIFVDTWKAGDTPAPKATAAVKPASITTPIDDLPF